MAVALVTGANGFLGSHVCRELDNLGIDVVTLNRSADHPSRRSFVLSQPFTCESLGEVVRSVKPGTIYHLAGTSCSDNLQALYQTNVFYAAHLLDAALRCKMPPTVVLVGSAAEYGRPLHSDSTVRENDFCSPLNAYGISKLAQTHHGLACAAIGLPVVVARLFNPIGIRSAPTTALGSFVNQIATMGPKGGVLKTGPLEVVRDFIDVGDAAKGLIKLASHPAAKGQVVNLCTGTGVSLQSLVDRLLDVAGVPIVHEVNAQQRGTSDLDIVIGDNRRLKSFGISIAPPDIERLLRRMLDVARQNGNLAQRTP
jgi:nucleoside-diphosphate-sugar epimerase